MALREITLFSVSILPVVLISMFIYKRDKNKESFRLLFKLFLGGICSCFLCLIATGILNIIIPFFNSDYWTLNSLELVIYVFVGIALVEELSKWIIAYKISYNNIEFDEIYDMILYCILVSLGFACFENLFYVYASGIKTGLLRALLSVPGHACNGFFMGYYLGLTKVYSLRNMKELKNKYLTFSILIPVLVHGLYDYCLFNGSILFMMVFYLFVATTFIYVIVKIIKISRSS